ncbi:MAG: hypothetical protein ACO1NM_02550 [Sphingobium phenoxybenzoativorans]|uniref:hypothetical protein n=1 Tax=Sphingobium phenoxybenzoativorans TaxID=1592790 RepID=UPI0008723A9E|nr:hypothetical protein [Sphingobium phenoxybenzoativorans]
MTSTINLLADDIQAAVDAAYERGAPVAVAYVNEKQEPSLSLRGSAQVLNANEIGLWARSTDTGLAAAIEKNANLSLIFFGPLPSGDKMLLSIKGQARADASRNDEVYNGMIENERNFDPDKKGVAIIVNVDSASGMSMKGGPFSQQR